MYKVSSEPNGTRSHAVFDLSTEGHRESYFQIFEKLWSARRVLGRGELPETKAYDHVVFLSVDDYFLTFFGRAVLRSISGQKTDGILLRAENLTRQKFTPKRLLKKTLLRALKVIPGVRTIGILPYSILPELKKYLTDTMYDLQFWDLPILFPSVRASEAAEIVFEKIRDHSKGRKIVLALGRQDKSKGILYFFDLWQNPDIQKNYYFAVIGKNIAVEPLAFEKFQTAGGFVWNAHVSEEDLLSAYSIADLIWCCYHPTYDVSSGIYGRSIQTGKPSLIREGSLLSRLADQFRSSARLKYNDVAGGAKQLSTLHLDSKLSNYNLRADFDRLYLDAKR